MADKIRVLLEIGPKGKKAAAVALDWPGLERGAKTKEVALERLIAYQPRYAKMAALAGLEAEFVVSTEADVVGEIPGTGSTDFWGISYAISDFDRQAISDEELERELTLMRACWTFFDEVRARVSAELQKGPRGGGRDRDHIVRHVIACEQDWIGRPALRSDRDGRLSDDELAEHRDAYCYRIRTLHAEGKMSGTWPLRYLIRHTTYHTLDHAWEMEDKDLTGTPT